MSAVATIRCFAVALALCLVSSSWTIAQERLIDEEPHDLLTIPDEKETQTLKVFPVRLPNRKLPKDPKPGDKIRVRLIDDDDSRDFEVQWRDVKQLELFESRVRQQAEAFTASQKFDEAYDNYLYLLKNFPNTEGLEASIQAYWYLSAGASFREKRYDEALSVLEELLRKNPLYKHSETSPSILRVLGEISDRIVQRYLDQGDLRSARQMIARLTTTYPESKQEPFYSKFESRMIGEAEKLRDAAREHLAAKRYTEAYDSTAAMLDVWPEVTGAAELAQEMAEQYPLAVVAVEQLSAAPSAVRIDRWADQRAGRLTDRRLTELRGVGPEGGNYICPLGSCEQSDDGRSLLLSLSPTSMLTAFDVLGIVLDGARPQSTTFSPAWARILGGARIVRPGELEASFLPDRSHMVPQALLAFPLTTSASEGTATAWAGAYALLPAEEKKARFVLPIDAPRIAAKPREIQERAFSDPEAAILALERGEVDALDRIQPGDLPSVRKLAGVIVGRYAVPTVHVLLPNYDRPWPASRTFRRAVMYGLNRELILSQGILKETTLAGAQLVSGPFPAPMSLNDPLSYAYDNEIDVHAYEPLLSATLANLAKQELLTLARTKGEDPPKFEGIVIGHQPLELHRIACKAMARQLAPLGIPCKTREMASDADAKDCDFVYTELLISEPLIDVVNLFGPRGFYPATNAHVRLGVRLVQQANTWNQAGQRLRQLHRTLHDDLTVLPLWQTPEHFALRKNVQGVSASPVSLYQDIDQWRVVSRLGQK